MEPQKNHFKSFYQSYQRPDLWKRYQQDNDPLTDISYPAWLVFKDTPNNQKHKNNFQLWFQSLDATHKVQFYEGVFYTESFEHPIFEQFPRNVKEWGAKNFIPNLGKKFTIPELVCLNMPNLIQLCLGDNNISNIESLVYLQTPVLRQIDFTGNFIRQIKALRKIPFKLNKLLFFDNPVVDPWHFSSLEDSKDNKYIGFGNQLQSPVFLAKIHKSNHDVLNLLKRKFTNEPFLDEDMDLDYYQRLIKSQSKVVQCLLRKK